MESIENHWFHLAESRLQDYNNTAHILIVACGFYSFRFVCLFLSLN